MLLALKKVSAGHTDAPGLLATMVISLLSAFAVVNMAWRSDSTRIAHRALAVSKPQLAPALLPLPLFALYT